MKILITLIFAIIILVLIENNTMSNIEQPDYKLVTSKGNIEIREYEPMIIAQVEVFGERKQAINEGFKILADYIFGNNTSSKKMGITAPVTNELSEKMAMTAPVLQERDMNKWKVQFIMPKKYSLETLPKPNSKEVILISLPARRFAVIQFSGLADDENIKQHTDKLKAFISDERLKSIGETIFAFYNPPWTIPFLRRNEIMIEIDSTIDSNFSEIRP